MTRSRLTVLQVVPALDSGGVERGTLEVGAELVRRGHRSLVVSSGGRLVETLEATGSRHIRCPVGLKSPFTLRWVPFLTRLFRTAQVDVVDVHSRLPGWIAWLAWRRTPPAVRPRLVTTVHGLHTVSRYSAIVTKGERVIAVSRTIRDYIMTNYPRTDPERVQVIHRGTADEEFPRGYRPSDEWQQEFFGRFGSLLNQRLITLPGRVTRLKGHRDFIRLIHDLKRREIPVRGLVVGGADRRKQRYLDELRREVTGRGLDGEITFTGRRSDIREIYAVSDVVVSLSSRPESFGRTVLEALNLGIPVVGYNHGGVGEILSDVYPQGGVPPGDHNRLLERVSSILLENGPTVPAVTTYKLAEMLEGTIRMYEELARESRAFDFRSSA